MKRLLNLFAFILVSLQVIAQNKPVNIVFDVTSADPSTHQSAIRHVSVMSSNYPDSQFEVVLYSGSVDMALKDKSVVAEEIIRLAENKNIKFRVCEMTLERKGINKSDLLPGFETVPDGIMEIVAKQNEGWGYIKESHK